MHKSDYVGDGGCPVYYVSMSVVHEIRCRNLHGMSAVFVWGNIRHHRSSHRRTWAFASARGTQSRTDCTLAHMQENPAYILGYILHIHRSCSLVASKVRHQDSEGSKRCCMGRDYRMVKGNKPLWM